jgi:hypothetical protein
MCQLIESEICGKVTLAIKCALAPQREGAKTNTGDGTVLKVRRPKWYKRGGQAQGIPQNRHLCWQQDADASRQQKKGK